MMQASSWVFVNGCWVPSDEAAVSVFDHGFLYGDGVFETLRASRGQILWCDRHVARLSRSCEKLHLSVPIAHEAWVALLEELLTRNRLSEALVRITVSRGIGDLGVDPSLCPKPTVVVMGRPLPSYPTDFKERGVRLAVAGIRRTGVGTQLPDIKSLSFQTNVLAKHEAVQAGAFDAVMLNADDCVTECTTSNLFFIDNGVLHTPAQECGLIPGITRDLVIELAAEAGLAVQQGCYPLSTVLGAQEWFLTNTGMGIMPIRQIGQSRNDTCPGPLTRYLQAVFEAKIAECIGSR
ncbi:MAG: branched-chain amino acid aminotransferase [Nitrospirae bacterium]|nr:MAG: branched-chain amino acid aminotransferase [Nitrospirota bacterium]